MSKTNPRDKKRRNPISRPLDPESQRSSPGSGEDEDLGGTADLQPEDVEGDDTAR